MRAFHLTITDIANILFEGEARSLSCTGASGDMVVLPGHMPLVTIMKPCDIRVTDAEGEEHTFPAMGGILEITNKNVSVLL